MNFAVERKSVPGGVCVAVAGEVDVATAPLMREALKGALASGEPVVVDLGSVTFMDSSGVRVLADVHATAKAAGNSLRLRAVPSPVNHLLKSTGLEVPTIEPATTDDLPS